MKKKSNQNFATNRKASFQYTLETRFESGIVLTGWEVVAIRQGQVNLSESHVTIKSSEAWLINAQITPLSTVTNIKADPHRRRKLLLNRKELNKLIGATTQKGMSIVPTKIYLKNGKMKLEIALGKGKKKHDKRQTLKDRAILKEQNRSLKEFKRHD